MQYGHFDDAAREYVITRPDTPRSWSNYLGTTRYGAIITNNAGGYSFFRSAAQGRFTRLHFNAVPLDQPGRYFYLKDRDSGDVWSSSWQPVGKSLETYDSVCRHGTAYTVITSSYGGVETEATYFVPLGAEGDAEENGPGDFEVWLLKVTNTGDRPRRLTTTSFVELASEWHFHHDLHNLQYSQYIIDMAYVPAKDGGTILHTMCKNLPEAATFVERDQSRRCFVSLVGAPVVAFDTDRDAFIGAYRTYANPRGVEAGCSGSLAQGDNGCGAMAVDLELAPGESRELYVLMGVGGAAAAAAARVAIPTAAAARESLAAVKAHWHRQLEVLKVKTPDPDLDSMVNVWNAYNCLITFAWSRAASLVYAGARDGLGFRDTLQDILGALPAIPDAAGERLRLMITGQLANGGAMPVVKPFAHRPGHEAPPADDEYRADDCLWMFNTVPAYVKETGDAALLDEVLPYADAGDATVIGHLRRAIEFNLERSGAHGLPCGLSADWNDALRFGPKGESLFVAFQLRLALATYLEICERKQGAGSSEHPGLGSWTEQTRWASTELNRLDGALQEHGWDGAWFLRGYREDGSLLGASSCDEGRVYLNSQAWAVFSGAATGDRALAAMDAVHEHLATRHGIEICAPPYEKERVEVVRSVLFNPGMKENGGIFCHPQGWAVIAETMLGRGDRAYEYYRAYMPSAYNDRAELREIEPYVHCQSTHGRASRRHGASRLPWLSGTASWSYVAATAHILGIAPDWDGLRIQPVLPTSWTGFTATRRFRGATYQITVTKEVGAGSTVRHVTVDGADHPVDAPVPVASPGAEVAVVVTLG